MKNEMNIICALCGQDSVEPFVVLTKRQYHICKICDLIFLDAGAHLSLAEEKKRYDTHQNSPQDKDYVEFLNQLVEPLSEFIKQKSEGLDFGCGPGPAISSMLARSNVKVYDYDPFYFPDKTLLNRKYDFIVSTEVVEHLRQPGKEFERIDQMLKKGGVLGIMTLHYDPAVDFTHWWYAKDPTHIAFYQRSTWQWIAHHWGWTIESFTQRTVILRKLL